MLSFQEDLLHYVWKLQYFDFRDLQSTSGEALLIKHPGFHNFDSGPDFSAGKIKLGDTVWHGNIEIHIKASDWLLHRHQHDEAYDNVILHVVYENDTEIYRRDGSMIPCLVLKGLVDEAIFERYHYLSANRQWVPCENLVTEVAEIQKKIWLERLFIGRLESKSRKIQDFLKQCNYNWEYTLFVMMGRYFGARVNTQAFESMCRSIDLYTIYKNRNDLSQVEALLYGQAGLLSANFQDEYPKLLKRNYKHLQRKYKLTPIEPATWKFFRLRPVNFPTVRIAQFAALIAKNQSFFSRLLEIEKVSDLDEIWEVKTNAYWDTHYVFDKEAKFLEKNIGITFRNTILINAVIPLIFVYGKLRNEAVYVEKAVSLMQALPAERNKIISKWKKLKFEVSNASDSQALLHLKREYCDRNRCLQCAIGHQVLKEDFPVYGLLYEA